MKEHRIKPFFHGDSKSNSNHYYLYRMWADIKKRCYNKNCDYYNRWGGRGITVYEPWIINYPAFKEWILKNLGERPKNYSIDRINNNGNYEPGNLRWATSSDQNSNKRNAKKGVLSNSLKSIR